ncbi:S41 family peptidase [Salinimicrobium xinjiangense]|uniref:S41 family peptidase n=1 Tax=Salinimicrobium xinjiangense TaxID=438596 RepID=UPI0004114C4F|nr:S41 family peptidase [Salinimicrobium xinjiangense]
MKKFFAPFLMMSLLTLSCSKDDVVDEEVEEVEIEEPGEKRNLEVERFIYRGMNDIYFYKSEVPELADNYFSSNTEKDKFLADFDSPEVLYEALQAPHDHFSFMTSDYVALTKQLQGGVAKTTGMDYQLHLFSNSENIYGYVRYVVPGTSAAEEGVQRGDFFTEIDGQQLTLNNYRDLFSRDSYSLRIAVLEGSTIKNTDKVVNLVNSESSENPVLISKVLEMEDYRIGYLMYNSFTPSFDSQLNAAFADLKSQNITHLVLDLRYNSGGNGETAKDLASMVTGQFNGEIMMRYQFNEDYQAYYQANYPEWLVQRFNDEIRTGEKINSLNLDRVYVLTTKRSASASEFVINGLDPYIDVVQIGDYTSGKYQGSFTLHDSPNFQLTDDKGNTHVNPNHKYALQPLVLKYANKNGVTDFVDGLPPDVRVAEDLAHLGTLGDPNETLLQAAINAILGNPQEAATNTQRKMMSGEYKFVGERDMFNPSYQRLIIENMPLMKPEEMN